MHINSSLFQCTELVFMHSVLIHIHLRAMQQHNLSAGQRKAGDGQKMND